jgi:hypothetical protein
MNRFWRHGRLSAALGADDLDDLDDLDVRVARGVAVLDRVDPGWWRAGGMSAIDLRALRMEDSRLCLLSQRYAWAAEPISSDPWGRTNPYLAGLRLLGVGQEEAAAHGFTGVDAERLTPVWRRAIARRRARAAEAAAWAAPGPAATTAR